MNEPYPYLSTDGETTIGGHVFKVEDTAQCTHEGRPVFEWTVTAPNGTEWTDTDLNGPAGGREPSEREMLGTLLCFIDAALESVPDGENAGLFPADMLASLAEHSDELGMERIMIEESLRIAEIIEENEPWCKPVRLRELIIRDLDTDISLEECESVLARFAARSED